VTPCISRQTRTLLLFFSAAGYVGWFSGLGDPTEAQGAGPASQAAITIARASAAPGTTVVRDPFARSSTPPAARPGYRRRPAESPTESFAPHIDVAAARATAAAAAVLRATIAGPRPVAYVEDGGAMDIVRVGDTLGNRRVVKIDLAGLTLADGSRLVLQDGSATAPAAPNLAARLVTLRFEDLRRMLAPRRALRSKDATPIGAAVAPAATYPTPGPLRTADTRGIPVGVNPTSDPNAPTPYPYPYPYAPPH